MVNKSTSDIYRGMFAGTILFRRLLKLVEKYKMGALCKGWRAGGLISWFSPPAQAVVSNDDLCPKEKRGENRREGEGKEGKGKRPPDNYFNFVN